MVEAYRYPNKQGLFIPLRNGKGEVIDYTWIDQDDYERISPYSWRINSNGYVIRSTSKGSRKDNTRKIGITIYLHREILGLKTGDGLEGDHLNGNVLDNRKENLKAVRPEDNKRVERENLREDLRIYTKPKMVQGLPLEKFEPRILNRTIRLLEYARMVKEIEQKETIPNENPGILVPIIRPTD